MAKPKKLYSIKRPIPLSRRRRDFKFVPHNCSDQCSIFEKEIIEDNPTKFIITNDSILMNDHNSLFVPLFFEFRRKNEYDTDCAYLSPCGLVLNTYQEIYDYLKISKSRLNVNQFCLTARIELFRDHCFFKVYAFRKDITNGAEAISIQFVNEFEPSFYPDFNYIKERKFALDPDVLKSSTEDDKLISCDCDDDCSDIEKCKCRQMTIAENKPLNPNNKAGYEFNLLNDLVNTAIYECNSKCKCKKNCLNRVAQNGIKLRLQVYKTKYRGFGLRYSSTDTSRYTEGKFESNRLEIETRLEIYFIQFTKGTFICSYEGLIVKNTRTKLEDENEYLMNLSYKHCYNQLIKESAQQSSQLKNESTQQSCQSEHESTQQSSPPLKERLKTDHKSDHKYLTIHDLIQVGDLVIDDSDTTFSDLTDTDLSDSSLSDHDDDHNKSSSIEESNDDNLNESARKKLKKDDDDKSNEPQSTKKSWKKDSDDKPKEPNQQIDSDFLIDTRESGNVSRFLNSSCNPNLACQPIYIETQNPLFVHFGLFAIKDIKAFTELNFDYFYGSNEEKDLFDCKCKSKKCFNRKKK